MEAIAGANRGGMAGCSCAHRDSWTACASGQRNSVSPGTNYYLSSRRSSLRVARQFPSSSTALQDPSHMQYYLHVQPRVRKDRLANSVLPKAVAGSDEAVVAERVRSKAVKKAQKIEMKMQKKLKKAARVRGGFSSSSSSSSSSESEADETTEAGARRKKINLEKLKSDWACISQSPVMNSIPTVSSSFVIGQPAAAQQPAGPVGRSFAAHEAKVISSADLMTMKISSGEGSQSGVSSGAHLHQTLTAGATFPRSPSADAAQFEVCMGGKCKKAGGQQILSAFQATGVNASACNKCMKKCKLAVNVRVHQDGDNVPQTYSGIGIQDVNALSRKHSGNRTASREAIQV